mgnify:CR=1 FL=1
MGTKTLPLGQGGLRCRPMSCRSQAQAKALAIHHWWLNFIWRMGRVQGGT